MKVEMGAVGTRVYPAACRCGTAAAVWPVVQAHDEWGAEKPEITGKNQHFSFTNLPRFVPATNGHFYQ